MQINAKFNVRGGTYPTIKCIHKNPNLEINDMTNYLSKNDRSFEVIKLFKEGFKF